MAWKGGHKNLCREIVVEKNLLQGWGHSWNAFLRWIAIRALDLANRPENRRNRWYVLSRNAHV